MIGKVISGRYQIIQPLGSGGFGQTFLAEDLQLPDRPQCVVKRLKPSSNDAFVLQTASRLFEAEARVLHRLGSHDRIPRLLAHLEENNEFYLVQDLIDGYELTQDLMPVARAADGYPIGRMNEAQAIAFLLDVLETLVFVHQQGAIHRDIKPANLMRRSRDGKLVLIDFGAVKQVGTAIASNSILTVAIGTDGYMPNEQAIGKPRPCSDLYAVGAIAIQGLTGVAPSILAEDIETGELAWRQSPVHASFQYRTHISDELAQVIDKLVKYDFRDRYQSAADVLTAVQHLSVAIAPTIFPANVQTNSQDITIISQASGKLAPTTLAPTTFAPSVPAVIPNMMPRDLPQFKKGKWLGIGSVGMVSAIAVIGIAVIGTVMVLRPSPVLKNDMNTTASSPNAKYLFLSERAIGDQDLDGKSALELDIMRNEVFARYGRRFQSPELQSYFKNQPWYEPRYALNNFPEDLLTPIELQNVQYIRDFQVRSAQKDNPLKNVANNLPDSRCDYTKRLISDPNPPINVRLEAGQDYVIVGTLENGTQIKVEGEKYGWLKISAPIAGWVAASRTKPICF
jgi:serine/threonine protein kinase